MVTSDNKARPGEVGVLESSNITYQIETRPSSLATTGGSVSGLSIDADDFNDDEGIKHGPKKISSWGPDNKFPNNLKSLYQNNIIPGLFDFKQDMFFGQGPQLYTYEGKKWVPYDDKEVLQWLYSWDHIDYLIQMFSDAAMQENMFLQVRRNHKKKISDLIFIDADECRLSVKKPTTNKSETIFVNNWVEDKKDSIKPYNVFDPLDPVKHKISMIHLKKKSAGFKYYAVPVYVGLLEYWIPLANEIPKFHLSRMQRSLNVKYHIKIPYESLLAIKEERKYSPEQLNKWLKQKLTKLDEMLSGAQNASKIFYSYIEQDSNGQEMAGWQIILVPNNEKEMSEANLQLYNETNQAITSAMQVQPSLACIQLGQKMSSGSEILNAYNLHVRTRTPIIRHLVLSPINIAIAHNWPGKNIRLGIADPLLVKQEENKSGVANDEE